MVQPSDDVRRWPDEADLTSEQPTLDGSLTEAAFAALPTQLALLDEEGDIIHTNRAWRAFGEANDITGEPDTIGEGFESCCDTDYPRTIQERAWTSPIWYVPTETAVPPG